MQPLHRRLEPEPVPALAGIERWREAGHDAGDVVRLDRNERVGGHPDWFVDELRARLTSELASVYPSPRRLHEELAASLGLPEERLLVTPGTDAALRAVHVAFVRPGDAVVRLDPTYAMIPVYGRMFSAEDVPVRWDAPAEALLEAVRPGVRLVVLANPNQPTGSLVPADAVAELKARCEDVGALLVLDEAYVDFSGETGIGHVAEGENVLVLRTFSKGAGFAGLRIGFAAGGPETMRALYKVRSAGETNQLAIEAARLAVARPELVSDYVASVAEGRALLEARARELGLEPVPGHANFLLLLLPEGRDPAALVAALRERGYLVRGAYPYPLLDRTIRVTLGPPETMAGFADALAQAVAG
ncbi:MAG TPA: histidinol-phosphate transaminase [Gaiellaceae bacterium]|nr:histidinol-phosphate transaminase [Gaiellaceae bacterium]